MKILRRLRRILLGAFATVLACACISILPQPQQEKAAADTTATVMFESVTVVKDNPQAGYDAVIFIFSGDVAAEYAVQSHMDGNQAKFTDFVYDYIKINGQTIRERVTAYPWANDTLYWGPGDEMNKMMFYVNRNTAAQEAGTSLKWDGTDTFEVLAGFTGTNGATVVANTRKVKYTANGIDKYVDEPVALEGSGSTVNLRAIAVNMNADGENDWINLDFDGAVTADAGNYRFSTYIYDYIKVNGKTLGEHRAAYGDETTNKDNAFGVQWVPYGSSYTHRILIRLKSVAMGNEYGLKNDGTDVIEVAKGFVGQNGKKTISDLRMVPYTENGLNAWLDSPVANEDTVNVTSVEVYPHANDGYYMLYVLFDNDLTTFAQNNSLSVSIYDKIKLNGKTIGAINAATPYTVSVLWNPGYANKLLLYVKKGVADGILVNTDCSLTIDAGFVAQNGATTAETYEYYFQHYQNYGADKILPSSALTGETTSVTAVSIYPKQDSENDWIFITFEKDVALENDRNANATVYEKILINGKTLGQHRQAYGEVVENADNAFGIEWFVVGDSKKALIRLKTVDAGNVYGLNLDGKDRIQFLSGFTTQVGDVTATDYDCIYTGGKLVETATLVNEYVLSSATSDETKVSLSIGFTLASQENDATATLEKLAFNGVAFSEIEDDKATAVWSNVDGKVLLNITLDKSLLAEEGKNTLTIANGFVLSSHLALTETISLIYNDEYVYWLKDRNFVFPAESLAVESIGAPRIISDGSFVVTVTFNKTLSEIRLQNFTAKFETLLQNSEEMLPGYYYTSEVVDNMVLANIPNSALNALKINGVSLAEIASAGEGLAEVSMYGNELMIVLSSDSEYAVKALDSYITVEIGEGFRSYRGGETTENDLYTYDYENAVWVVGEIVDDPSDDPVDTPDSSDSSSDMASDGPSDNTTEEKGCMGSVASGFGVLLFGLCGVTVCKKKKDDVE